VRILNRITAEHTHFPRLRVCASCEWIFKTGDVTCPKCQFGSYGARRVYGQRAYQHAKTQVPWKQKKLNVFQYKLDAEIKAERRTLLEEVKLSELIPELAAEVPDTLDYEF